MEIIYQSTEITVLHFCNEQEYIIERLDVNATPAKGNTHLPCFPKKKLYINLGGRLYWFIPSKSIYGLRSYKENGDLSPIQIATFCEMEGVDNGLCVILGNYEQSADCDWLDNASPYSDPPYGRMDFWSNIPSVFYESKEKYEVKKCFYPKLVKVRHNYCEFLSIPEEKNDITTQPTSLRPNARLKPNDLIVVKVNRNEEYLENPMVKEYLSKGYVVERKINLTSCSVWLRKKAEE